MWRDLCGKLDGRVVWGDSVYVCTCKPRKHTRQTLHIGNSKLYSKKTCKLFWKTAHCINSMFSSISSANTFGLKRTNRWLRHTDIHTHGQHTSHFTTRVQHFHFTVFRLASWQSILVGRLVPASVHHCWQLLPLDRKMGSKLQSPVFTNYPPLRENHLHP